jgi:hypothetical protein
MVRGAHVFSVVSHGIRHRSV